MLQIYNPPEYTEEELELLLCSPTPTNIAIEGWLIEGTMDIAA